MPSRTALVFQSRGDPGILSVFKKIGKGIAGFVTGGPVGALQGIIGGSGTKTKQVLNTVAGQIPRGVPAPQIKGAAFATGARAAGAAAAVGATAIARRIVPKLAAGGLPAKAGKILAGGALFELGGFIFDAITGENLGRKKIRRMNVLNPRALSRATRRLSGFNKRSRNVEKQLRKLAPPARRRAAHHDVHHHGHHGHHD